MIPTDNIKSVFVELGKYLSCSVIRAEQRGAVPDYPFMTYKNITINNESAHQNIRITEETDDGVDVIAYEFTDEIFSLNFLDKDRIDRVRELSRNALRWFKSFDGVAYGRGLGITFQLIGNSVQDRTTILDAYQEARYGFDVRMLYNAAYLQSVEAIDIITITPEIDGDEKEKIIIGE